MLQLEITIFISAEGNAAYLPTLKEVLSPSKPGFKGEVAINSIRTIYTSGKKIYMPNSPLECKTWSQKCSNETSKPKVDNKKRNARARAGKWSTWLGEFEQRKAKRVCREKEVTV
jgi:hypothetical protein